MSIKSQGHSLALFKGHSDFKVKTCFSQKQLEGLEPKLGWSGGAMVLGKRPMPGRPTIWITVGQGPTALAVSAGGGCLDILLSSILSLLFLPFFGRRHDID